MQNENCQLLRVITLWVCESVQMKNISAVWSNAESNNFKEGFVN